MMQKIEKVVKHEMWRTCKFITNETDLEAATLFVFTILDDKVYFKDWKPLHKAEMILSYKKAVSTYLNAKRNYAQSQSRDAVIKYGTFRIDSKGTTTSGRDKVRAEGQDENTPANEVRWVKRAPPDLFQDRLIVAAATR
jgi:hypothetical protein